MRIRQAKPDDLSAIMLIENENFNSAEAASRDAMRRRLSLSPETFLVVEEEKTASILGYLSSVPCPEERLMDELFSSKVAFSGQENYLAILSLSVLSGYKGQGIGTMLLAALKDVAIDQSCQGITLTCHEELVSYYEANGFIDIGYSGSTHGGSSWVDMLWTP